MDREARLSALRELDLSRTNISGTLGTTVGSLHRIARLQLDHTALTGTLPTELGSLALAEALFVHGTSGLSGTLPSQLGRLRALRHGSSFASTGISGTIPTAQLRLELQQMMQKYAPVYRNGKDLIEGVALVKETMKKYKDVKARLATAQKQKVSVWE